MRHGVRRLISAADAGHVALALRSFEELRKTLPPTHFERPFLFNLVLKACVVGKDWRRAEQFFATVPRPSARSYGKLLQAAAMALHLEEAERRGEDERTSFSLITSLYITYIHSSY